MFGRAKNWVWMAALMTALGAGAQAQQVLPANPSALFFLNPSGTTLSQTVTISPAPSSFTASVSTTFTGTWLTVTSASTSSGLTLTATVNTSALANGVYTGRITITAAGYATRVIPVTLTIDPVTGGSDPAPTPILYVAPDSVSLQAVQGGVSSTATVALINSATENYDWSATANVSWITITPSSGHGDTPLQITASATSLGVSNNTGLITITGGTGALATLTAKINLTFAVTANQPPTLGTMPAALTFTAVQNSNTAASQVVFVNNSGSQSFPFTATSTLASGGSTGFGGGGSWLTIAPVNAASTTVQSQGEVIVTANPGSLSAGLYSGAVTVTQAANKQTIPVYMRVGKAAVSVGPKEIFFGINQGVSVQSSNTITLSGGPTSGTAYTVKLATTSGGQWFAVTPVSGTVAGNGTLTVSLQSSVAASLTPGIYYGQVLISLPGSAQESTAARVILKVFATTDTPRLQVSGGITAATPQGPSTVTNTQPVLVLGGPSTTTLVGISYSTASGGNWLTVLPQSLNISPASPGSITVEMAGNGLLPGTYFAKIVLTASNAAIAPVTIPVTLVVTPPSQVSGVAPGPLTAGFGYPVTGSLSSPDLSNPINVQVVDSYGAAVSGATVVVTSSNGEPPLVLSASAAGTYIGQFHALSAGPVVLTATAYYYSAANGLQVSPVAITTENLESPTTDGVIYVNGVVNAASYAPGPTPVSPGSLASIFGLRIAGAGGAAGPPFPLPTSLGGASVTVGGIPGSLIAAVAGGAGGDQVNLQLPFELEGQSTAEVISTVNGAISPTETVVLGAIPAAFTIDESGNGTAAVLHAANFAAVTAANPALAGEQLAIYATGLGPVNTTVATGAAAPGNAQITSPITVVIGGQNATVAFAGLAPGFAGLYQVNAVMPSGAGSGNVSLVIAITGNASTGAVTIPAR